MRELIAEFEQDPTPLDTLPELAALRALFQDFIERYDEVTEALIAWHGTRRLNPADQESLRAAIDELEELKRSGADFTERQAELLDGARRAVAQLSVTADRPRGVLDLSDAVPILSEITKAVERIERARSANAITVEQLRRFLFAFERILRARIEDPGLLAEIQDDLLAVRL